MVPLLLLSDQVVKLGDLLITSAPSIIISIATLISVLRTSGKTDKVKEMVNGRMDELLARTRELAHHEGKKEAVKELVEQGSVEIKAVPLVDLLKEKE